jgi:hypothetical protein
MTTPTLLPLFLKSSKQIGEGSKRLGLRKRLASGQSINRVKVEPGVSGMDDIDKAVSHLDRLGIIKSA